MSVRIVARARRDRLGEGPLWSPSQDALFWVDILGQRLNRLSLADETTAEWAIPEPIGWVIERRHAPGFIAGLASGFVELSLDPLTIAPIVDPEAHLPANRFNDAKADAQGRIWAGTMSPDGATADAALYRLTPDRTVTRMDHGYRIANGPAISPDGRWLFHTDSALRQIYRYPLAEDGMLGARGVFVTFDDAWGHPDGMTFDADGGLWVAHWGGGRISRFDPAGRIERAIALPASQITSCAFAGAALDRLFVTSAANGVDEPEAGGLFEVDAGVRGLIPHRFGG